MAKDDRVLLEGLQPARYGNGRRRQRLFLPEYLNGAGRDEHIAGPQRDAAHEILIKWADLEDSGRLTTKKETSLHGEFLTDIVGQALGYTLFSENESHWEVEPEFTSPGVAADAAIGFFPLDSSAAPRVLIELKGPTVDLDRHRFNGRTPVQQLWDYLNAVPDCPWGIVSNFVSFRLYHRNRTPQAYELFTLQDLREVDVFHRFYFLFDRGGLLAKTMGQQPRADRLLARTVDRQREVGAELYKDYHENRTALIGHLRAPPLAKSVDDAIHIAQKLMDRIVFVAFCEDRGLLPAGTIRDAWDRVPPFSRVTNPRWTNFRDLFRSIDEGNEKAAITAYNGGLFAVDARVDDLELDDRWTDFFREVSRYDFCDEVNVDVLGHLFEQSISDLETLRADPDAHDDTPRKKVAGRRKREGIYYTPAYVTEYIIRHTIGACLDERFAALAQKHEIDPARVPTKKTRGRWLAYHKDRWEAVRHLRVCDPACGSGAFLIQAYDYLEGVYDDLITALCVDPATDEDALRNQIAGSILQNNLFGVDLSAEAVEITQLALWIRTAQRGRTLADLSHNIRRGNSVVGDASVHPDAFDWSEGFPDVTAEGGFDAVIGNPPYVRQEVLAPFKKHLESRYKAYHGMADLYVYFFEQGLSLLRPGGRLSFVVTNKWMKAGYGKPLRRLFAEHTWVESVVDFGHAKQIFVDADVFPGITVLRKPSDVPAPAITHVCAVPREQLRIDDLSHQVAVEGFQIPREQLSESPWTLDPPDVTRLLEKIRRAGTSLREFAGVEPLSGIKTGYNEAFLIDTRTRDELVKEDSASADIIKPYLRGQDIKRWSPDWAGLWMIVLKSSGDHAWPWADAGEQAERVFQKAYPAVHAHMHRFHEALVRRQDHGRYWWELRACAYWDEFEKDKILYPEITWTAQWCVDTRGFLLNNTAYFLPSVDPWVVAVANAPVNWWYAWRNAVHGKDEALRFIRAFVQTLSIPRPNAKLRALAEAAVGRLIRISGQQREARRNVLDWLRIEHDVDKPSRKLQSPAALDSDAFIVEVRQIRGKRKSLTAAGLRSLRDEYASTVEPVRKRAGEARKLERKLSDLVNQAYGLTPEDVALMWKTAPPRMPTAMPGEQATEEDVR